MFQVWIENRRSNDLEEEKAFKLYEELLISNPSCKIKLVEEICYEGYFILKQNTYTNPYRKTRKWLGLPRI